MSKEKGILISVIVSTYNRRIFIERCLDSLASNTLEQGAFEVICVDDCSTDDTQSFLKRYKKITNFTSVFRKTNSGTAAIPRNEGLKKAKGKYVFFIDSDDMISEYTLADALETALRNNSDMVCLPYWTNVARKTVSNDSGEAHEAVSFLETSFTNSLMAVGKLIKRELLTKWKITFPEHIRVHEDTLFAIKCYAAAKNISIISGDRKYYFIESYHDGTLPREQVNPEHIAFMISDAVHFIFSLPGSDLESKISLSIYFINRMHAYVGDHVDAVKYLHNNVGHYFELFRDKPLSVADYFVQGVQKNNPKFITNSLKKMKSLNYSDIVAVDNGKIYTTVDMEDSPIRSKINVAHMNTVTTILSKFTYKELHLHLEFYVYNSLLVNYSPVVSLLAVERRNQKKQKKVVCRNVSETSTKFQVSLDLIDISLLLGGIVDFFVEVELNGYIARERLKAEHVAIPGDPSSVSSIGQKYLLSVGDTLMEFFAFVTKQNRLSMSIEAAADATGNPATQGSEQPPQK